MVSLPESIRACLRAAASSIRILGTPVSIALAIPPRLSHFFDQRPWLCTPTSWVEFHDSMTQPRVKPPCRYWFLTECIFEVLRAIRAEKIIGKCIASSSAFGYVGDCVWPNAAAIASIQVRAYWLKRILLGKGPSWCFANECAMPLILDLSGKLLHVSWPKHTCSAHLSYFHKMVHPYSPEKMIGEVQKHLYQGLT